MRRSPFASPSSEEKAPAHSRRQQDPQTQTASQMADFLSRSHSPLHP